MTEIRRPDSSSPTFAPATRPGHDPATPSKRAPDPDPVALGSQVAPAQRKAELTTAANRAVALASHATQSYLSSTIAGDEPAALKAHDQATTQLAHYQAAVTELTALGQAYVPPQLPEPDHELLVRQALVQKFEQRLAATEGHPLGKIGAELRNDLESIGQGLVSGSRHLWDRMVHFVHHPAGDARRMFVDSASLLLHPIRNLAHLMQALHRFGDKSRYEQLMDLADVVPGLVLAPAVVPILADAKEGIRRSEKLAHERLLDRVAQDGAHAPPGRTAVGTAVNRAVWGTRNGTVDRTQAVTSGVIDAIWMNRPDGQDAALHQVCELIRKEAKQEVCFQTYIFDRESPAARELLSTLAEKQRENPDFKIHISVDRPGIEQELVRYGIHADVAVVRPLISRGAQHAKTFILDGRIGVIGGDNVDNPEEKDLMVRVHGPVVQAMLADFDAVWQRADSHIGGDATPPRHPPADTTVPTGAVPMTLLGKKGETSFYAREYEDNDADQGILAALAAARSEIKIESPNLNADAILRAIRDAAERGVKVKINIPLDYNKLGATLDAGSNRAFLAFMAELPAAAQTNVELRNFSTSGREGESNHTKFVAVDGEWAYVGSQNMDNQSFSFSRELGVGIDDPEQAQRLISEVFDKDWATSIPTEPGWFAKLVPHALFDH